MDAFIHTIVNLKYLKVALQVEAALQKSDRNVDLIISGLFIFQLILLIASEVVTFVFTYKQFFDKDAIEQLSLTSRSLVLIPAYIVCLILAVSLYKFWNIQRICPDNQTVNLNQFVIQLISNLVYALALTISLL